MRSVALACARFSCVRIAFTRCFHCDGTLSLAVNHTRRADGAGHSSYGCPLVVGLRDRKQGGQLG